MCYFELSKTYELKVSKPRKKRTINESDPELVTSREKALPTGYFDNSNGHNSLKHCLDN